MAGRRRVLTNEQAEQLYEEYQAWLNNAPKQLMARYGISRHTVLWYGQKKHKTKLSVFDPLKHRRRAA